MREVGVERDHRLETLLEGILEPRHHGGAIAQFLLALQQQDPGVVPVVVSDCLRRAVRRMVIDDEDREPLGQGQQALDQARDVLPFVIGG